MGPPPLEDRGEIVRWNADAGVGHGEAQGHVLEAERLGLHMDRHFALTRELDGIANQIDGDLTEPSKVTLADSTATTTGAGKASESTTDVPTDGRGTRGRCSPWRYPILSVCLRYQPYPSCGRQVALAALQESEWRSVRTVGIGLLLPAEVF